MKIKISVVMLSCFLLSACLNELFDSSMAENSAQETVDAGVVDAGVISLSGVIAAAALPAAKLQLRSSSDSPRRSVFGTRKLAQAKVSLYKRTKSGVSTLVDETTSDDAGQYSFASVPKAVTANGNEDDFYYEVRATLDEVDISAPVAPDGDTTVDVTPETNVAAKVLSDVVKVPGESTPAIPSAASVNALRRMVSSNMVRLGSSISVPQSTSSNSTRLVSLANGLSSAGGNAELAYKAYQFQSEWSAMKNATTTTPAKAASYLSRLAREACGQNSNLVAIPQASAKILAQAIVEGKTYTAEEIISASNSAIGGTQLNVDAAVSAYANLLSKIDSNYAQAEESVQAFTDEELVVLFAKRDLKGSNFSATTALNPDQALNFLQHASANGNSMNLCNISGAKIGSAIAYLVNAADAEPHISNVEISHDSGFGCDQSAGFARFLANVHVFDGGKGVNSVTILSSDSSALTAGSVNLELQMGKYESRSEGVCVSLNQEVTYTITANFADNSSVTKTLTRTHPLVPEASAKYDGVAMGQANEPTQVNEKRPVISWDAPDEMLARVTNAPTGSQIKYSYEFSHTDAVGSAPLALCDSVPFGDLYAVDNFMPTVDCDKAKCAAATEMAESELQCRVSIQTYLVDENDSILGQAAGNFRFFKVVE